jgi:hypothetical protein
MVEIEKNWKMNILNWHFFKVWDYDCKSDERSRVVSEVFPKEKEKKKLQF